MRVLEVSDLVTGFPAGRERIHVIDGVSLYLEAGETLALVGESGCGKSMTALSILRLVPRPGRVEAGKVLLEGRDLLSLAVPDMRNVRGAEISMIFQEPMTSLNPVARVGKQVVEAIRLHEKVGVPAARERTLELFRRAGIPDAEARLDAYPHQLSGGLKQRVMIAMALATRPKVLIADEPTTALDVTIQAQILELLRELKRDFGTAILLITHDIGVVNELADRVAVMYGGRVVEEGDRSQVLGEPAHPYTQGLLRSMPGFATAHERLAEIPGVVPPPAEWPAGCRFDTRCERVLGHCRSEAPAATPVGEGHRVFCHAVASEIGEAP
ncbi:MAG: ABC transporter ATP-binding protein [Myxococcota bacterium]|nr:ABC transporter ATP-binding protein [Myxococcota bacterium]